jgi:putative flippase GtrA
MDKPPGKLQLIQTGEALRFLVGGGSAVAVDYLTYQMLLHFGAPLSAAKAISYVCGAGLGFVINKYWTFTSRAPVYQEIPRFIGLYAVTACANTLVNKAVLWMIDVRALGFLCATGVSTVLNFLGLKFIVFRRK